MKSLSLLFAMMTLSSLAFAGTRSVAADVDNELDQVIETAEQQNQEEIVEEVVEEAPMVRKKQVIIKKIVVPAQAQVQKQPTTIIEASPLTESKAEQMRKSRIDTEMQTEQKIVEKLEQSRIEDEKKRASVLFGDKFEQMNSNQQPVQQQPVVVAPVVQPINTEVIRNEIKEALKSEQSEPLSIESKFMTVGMGLVDLPNISNAKGNYSFTIGYGKKIDSLIVEGSFLYGNYTMDSIFLYNMGGYYYGQYSYSPMRVNIDQYAGSMAIKYQLIEDSMIKPILGALLQYSYRSFNVENPYAVYNSYLNTTATSQSVDVALNAGLDFDILSKLTLGLDLKYFTNVYSRMDSNYNWRSGSLYGTPIEKVNYYVWSLVGRMSF